MSIGKHFDEFLMWQQPNINSVYSTQTRCVLFQRFQMVMVNRLLLLSCMSVASPIRCLKSSEWSWILDFHNLWAKNKAVCTFHSVKMYGYLICFTIPRSYKIVIQVLMWNKPWMAKKWKLIYSSNMAQLALQHFTTHTALCTHTTTYCSWFSFTFIVMYKWNNFNEILPFFKIPHHVENIFK